jgi:hypothetical protein
MSYHDRPEISASKLKSLLGGSGSGLAWREYEARYVTRTIPPIETTKAMEWGNVVETVLLEPLKVQKRVYVGPSKDQYEDLLVTMDDLRHYCERWSIKPGKTKAATVAAIRAADHNPSIWDEILKDAEAERGDRIQITAAEYQDVLEIVDLVYRDPNGAYLFDPNREVQPVKSWLHQPSGLMCRGMADVALPQHKAVIDIKTTRATSVGQAKADFLRLGYWLQDAQYSEGWGADRFYFMAITSTRPWRLWTFEYSLRDRLAFAEYRCSMLKQLAARIESNDWAEETEGRIVTLHQPDWWHTQMEGIAK